MVRDVDGVFDTEIRDMEGNKRHGNVEIAQDYGNEQAPPARRHQDNFEEEDDDDEKDDVYWKDFDEVAYIDKKRCSSGQDCYGANKFNQLASDNTKSNRHVPDTRNTL